MQKQCFACKATKDASEFYNSPQTKDGLMTYCKECHKAKIADGRAARIANTIPVRPAPGSLKFCRHCGVEKPVEDFGNNRTTSDGLQSVCKPCAVAMVTASRHKDPTSHRRSSKAWREANPERHRDNNLHWKLGLPHGTYDQMLAAQNGRCAICGTTDPGTRIGRFNVDHCHDTSAIRGLLCSRCNTGIGQLRHDVQILAKAIQYLSSDPLTGSQDQEEGA